MATNVPAPVLGPRGFIIPDDAAILAGVLADMNAAFGGNLNLALNTPQGQLASSMTAIISAAYQTFLYYTTQVDPAYAQGRMQDAIARIYFLERLPAQPTYVQCVCVGASGTVIPPGALAADTGGNIYACSSGGSIPVGGSVTLQFQNIVTGPIACPAGSLTSIYQAITGWDTINNPDDGVLGNDAESRGAFEARRAASVERNSIGSLPSVLGAVLSVNGVDDAYVTENSTGSPVTIGGYTLAANSIYVAAVGGTDLDVATAIWSRKAPGCAYNGNTTVTVTDDSAGYVTPYPTYSVTFERPIPLRIYFSVTLVDNPFIPSDANVQIQNAIINAFSGVDGGDRAVIGGDVLASRFYAPVASLGPWAKIQSLYVGSKNVSAAVFSGTISGTTLTVGYVSSGTIAIGQSIEDNAGLIIPGTTITAGSGSTWTVSNTQTLAAATFTGTGSGTNLTASAVTGTIHVGDMISGTGVTAGTTIVSQTSGTTGGAGVYVTSAATTSSGASLTSRQTISGIAVTALNVQAGIAQVPVTDALVIYTSHT